ncbi:hypothetical protein DFS34DRAFT_653264 [Phlyctochytrium arcticum]|nr:hypothetical protein DFS34DRAFT_653264 [Phlyctochytrium arcticum]
MVHHPAPVAMTYAPFMTEYRLAFKDPSTTKKPRKSVVSVRRSHELHDRACKKPAAKDWAAHRRWLKEMHPEKEIRQQQQLQQQQSQQHTKKNGAKKSGSAGTVTLPPLPQASPRDDSRVKTPPKHSSNNNNTHSSSDASAHHHDGSQSNDNAAPVYHQSENYSTGPATGSKSRILAAPGAAPVGYGADKPRYDIITGFPIHGEPHSGYKEGQRAVIETLAHVNAVANARTPHYNIITGSDALAPIRAIYPQTREIVEIRKI